MVLHHGNLMHPIVEPLHQIDPPISQLLVECTCPPLHVTHRLPGLVQLIVALLLLQLGDGKLEALEFGELVHEPALHILVLLPQSLALLGQGREGGLHVGEAHLQGAEHG